MATRADAVGLFWQDVKKVKAPAKEKIKRVPPFPFWREPDYLPGLEEAMRFDVPQFTDAELVIAAAKGERLIYDIESYPNYWCISFQSVISRKTVTFEQYRCNGMCGQVECDHDIHMSTRDYKKLDWIVRTFTTVTFNGKHYDEPILRIALLGHEPQKMWDATEAIIGREERGFDVMKAFGVKTGKTMPKYDHIDIRSVAPLDESLKMYAARLHYRRLQDLPFKAGTVLSREQAQIVKYYNINDLGGTQALYDELLPAISLREQMSQEYKTDLRSKSDAQVAEAVILSGMRKITGQYKFPKPDIDPNLVFKYKAPDYIKFRTPLLNGVLNNVLNANFTVNMVGEVIKPDCFPMDFTIADSHYTMGIGGLHSTEKSVTHKAGTEYLLIDRDFTSFYPKVILTQKLFPKHLGNAFLKVYQTIVTRRVAAKENAAAIKEQWKGRDMPKEVKAQLADLNLVADSLKITINGSFGKFGNGFSMLYSPNLMVQVTLTGQLVLLMLIERLELAGIKVVSANTDGILIKAHVSQKELCDQIIAQLEKDIDCATEETQYISTHNKDVNNYFAVKKDGEVKVKGIYAERGSAGNSVLSKSPKALIVSDAVMAFITKGTPTDHTIRNCKDIRRFVCVQHTKFGAVKVYSKPGEPPSEFPNEYLGKTVRWYYSSVVKGEIVGVKSGNKISSSDGARPCMELPKAIPEDIDYKWYEERALKVLNDIGIAA